MGRGCTGIEGVYDSDMINLDDVHNIEPIIIVTQEDDDDDSESVSQSVVVKSDIINTENPEHESNKTPLWARRRRPQLSQENERTKEGLKNAQTELFSSFKNVNDTKIMAEEIKLQLLQEELTFKRELQQGQLEEISIKRELLQRQLEEMSIKIETALYERDIKKEVLGKLQDGTLDVKKLYE